MKPMKRKKLKNGPDSLPKTIEALAELTSSDVISELKLGLSRLGPLEQGEEFSDSPY